MAERMGKDPAVLTRLLSHPSNMTLDTISDILLALDAEAEPPVITKFKDKAAPNYIHPLVAKALKTKIPSPTKLVAEGLAETAVITVPFVPSSSNNPPVYSFRVST